MEKKETKEEKTMEGIRFLPIRDIDPFPLAPRDSFDAGAADRLAQSVRKLGIIRPLIVRPAPQEEQPLPDPFLDPDPYAEKRTRYEVICGERRLRAARRCGIERVPCRIVQASDAEALVLLLSENCLSLPLSPRAVRGALRTLGKVTGKRPGTIAGALGLPYSAPRKKGAIGDVRPVINSVRRLIDAARAGGLFAAEEIRTEDGITTITLRIGAGDVSRETPGETAENAAQKAV